MKELFDFEANPVAELLPKLLKDKTTGKNIIWATDSYSKFGELYSPQNQITPASLGLLPRGTIMPRVGKTLEQQAARTRAKAEVFTPSWIVNQMINYRDSEWFGRENVFNIEIEQGWKSIDEKIVFPNDKKWQDYVMERTIEITCGEAPFIVSRYDTTTGEIIPLYDRIGMLDRKLRVIAENIDDENKWNAWVMKAYQSTYGYEFQGDSLILARINLLQTYIDYYLKKWNKKPTLQQLTKIANVIVWNIWQMDGLSGTIPGGKIARMYKVISLDLFGDTQEEDEDLELPCKIYDWRANHSVLFKDFRGENK